MLYSTDGDNFSENIPSYTKAGRYTINVRVEREGIESWESGPRTVQIAAKEISADMISSMAPVKYTEIVNYPVPKVTFKGKTLKNGEDYYIQYNDYTKKWYIEVSIYGKGNFTGKVTVKVPVYKHETKLKLSGLSGVKASDLSKLFSDSKVYTSKDKAIEKTGGSAKLQLSAKLIKKLKKADKKKLEKAAKGKKLGAFIDISLLKTITKAGKSKSESTKASNLSKALKIKIPITKNLKGKKGIAVYRLHNGKASAIPQGKKKAQNGEYFTTNGKTITLYVNKFSTFAIGYKGK